MASKVASQGYSIYETSSSGLYASPEVSRNMNRASSVPMDVDSILHQLNDPSSNQRVAALDQLFDFVRHSPNGDIRTYDSVSLFQSLALALRDPTWEVKQKALNVLSEVTTRDGSDVDNCMMVVLPHLVPCLGDSKVSVRRAAIQCTHTYMRHTNDFPSVVDAIIRFGLEAEDVSLQKDSCVAIPLFLTPDFCHHDFFGFVQALTKKLLAREDVVLNAGLKALESIRGIIGEVKFMNHVNRLSPALQQYYYRVSGSQRGSDMKHSSSASSLSVIETLPTAEKRSPEVSRKPTLNSHGDRQALAFGLVPTFIMDQLEDSDDFRLRAQAVDDLKTAVAEAENINEIIPHLGQFLTFLLALLDDTNFKITTVTLEVLIILVDRLGVIIQPHFRQIVVALSKRLGDNKIVVRQAVMRLAILLMQNLKPHTVLSLICENLRNRNSRVRQETLNITICALLTFPSTDFDQPLICRWVAPCLTDAKRAVRHAALECMAVLAQSMGAGNLQPIVDAVEESASQQDGSELLKAVQARLARRQLPRYTVDGLIEYSSPVPTSASHKRSAAQAGADSELVLAANSSTGSARSRPAELVDLEGPVAATTEPFPSSLERRRVSAGKVSKAKLPWEQEDSSAFSTPARSRAESPTQNGMLPQSFSKAADVPPLKPRGPPTHDEYGYPYSSRKSESKRVQELQSGVSSARSVKATSGSQSLPASGRVSPQNQTEADSNTYRQLHMSARVPAASRTQRKLEPLSATSNANGVSSAAVVSALNNGFPQHPQQPQAEASTVSPESACPIPTRPALVRSAGKRRGIAPLVPPIPLSSQSSSMDREEPDSGIQSAAASATRRGSLPFTNRGDSMSSACPSSPTSDIEDVEMHGSLTTIRSSASRKKAMRVFEEAERRASVSRTSPTSPPNLGTMRHSKSDSRLASTTTGQANQPTKENPMVRTKYSPYSGATFKENPTYDGKIIGRRVGDEAIPPQPIAASVGSAQWENGLAKTTGVSASVSGAPNTSAFNGASSTNQTPPKPKERRRQVMKGLHSGSSESAPVPPPLLTSNDITPPSSPVSMNNDAEMFNIIGRGVFDIGRQDDERSTASNAKGHSRRGSKSEVPGSNPPSGIVGIGLEKTSSLSEDDEANFQDSYSKPTMSKTFQESLAQKKRLQQLEAEQRRLALISSRDSFSLPPSGQESQRDPVEELPLSERDKYRRQNASTGNLNLDVGTVNTGNAFIGTTSAAKPPAGSGTPKRPKPRNSDFGMKSPNTIHSISSGFGEGGSGSSEDPETSGPFLNADKVFPEALQLVAANDWQSKCQGLSLIRRLAHHHKEVLLRDLHPCVLAVTQELKNLRSQVARSAIQSLGDLYLTLGRSMDSDLDLTVRMLLHKSGDSSTFIRDDVETALGRMVDNVTPQRAVTALIQGGGGHRNMQVRRFCARNLCLVCERMGPGRVLSGVKEVTDRILPTAAQFTMDGSPETRWFGRRIFHGLLQHQDFNRMCQRYIAANTWRNMQDIISNLRSKGLGECPSSTPSAGMRRSDSLTRGSSAGSLTAAVDVSSSPSGPARGSTSAPHPHGHQTVPITSTYGPGPGRRHEAAAEEAKRLVSQLTSTNWSVRHGAVTELVEWCETDSGGPLRLQTTRILDAFVQRLTDSNSKVNLYALQSLEQMLPALKELHLGPVISVMVQHTAANLASKNQEMARTASRLLDAFIDQLDPTMLVQAYVQAVTSANSRIKPEMINKLSTLTDRLCPRKPRLVTLHVLPELWRLLINLTGAGSGGASSVTGCRGAVQALVAVLHDHMRDDLLEMGRTHVNATPRMLQLLSDMVDNVGRGG